MATDVRQVLEREYKAILVCLFVCIGAFQYGYDQSYFSGARRRDP